MSSNVYDDSILGEFLYFLSFTSKLIVYHFQGLQSTHGLVELIGYLIRLIITCLALLCVIPTAIRWRRERQVMKQLQSLASRLQMSTPNANQSYPNGGTDSLRTSNRKMRRRSNGFDNPGFIQSQSIQDQNHHHLQHQMGMMGMGYGGTGFNQFGGSQNEFNASIFGLNPSQYIGPPITQQQQNLCKCLNSYLVFIWCNALFVNYYSVLRLSVY